MKRVVLAINPPIYDFSAYDLWLKPYGFLHLLSLLEAAGIKVEFIDCLDRLHPSLTPYLEVKLKTDNYGCGKFPEEKIAKPQPLKWVPRYYRRYGWPHELIIRYLRAKRPDLILITSSMTYWYPGIQEILKILKELFPSIPILLGGTYVNLCKEHAEKQMGVDSVITSIDMDKFADLLKALLNLDLEVEKLYHISPSYNFYPRLHYVVIRTSWGCPFNCSYCGIRFIHPSYITRDIDVVYEEILKFYQLGIKNFVFYDDALLYQPERIKYLLKKLNKQKIDLFFHTPNGLHARYIDEELAELMYKARFVNPRLSLESIDEEFQRGTGAKVYSFEIERAISFLRKAGYKDWEYSIYLLVGLPGENLDTVEESILYAKKLKAKPLLAEYSPIPGTPLAKGIRLPLDEPLFHNNTILPAYELKDWPKIQKLKNLAHKLP